MMGKRFLAIALAVLIGLYFDFSCPESYSADEVIIMEQKDIVLLPDDKLIDIYIDVLAEMEASKTFHATSGFTPKEYKKYRELVKYRLRLMFELHRRKLELPPSVI